MHLFNYCWYGNTITCSPHIVVNLHVAVNSIKVFSVAKYWFNIYDISFLHCCQVTKYFVLLSTIKMYLGLNIMCSAILSEFNQYWSLLMIFIKAPNIKFHEYPATVSRTDVRVQTDMLKLTGTFCNLCKHG